jgi:hypothetical protein
MPRPPFQVLHAKISVIYLNQTRADLPIDSGVEQVTALIMNDYIIKRIKLIITMDFFYG